MGSTDFLICSIGIFVLSCSSFVLFFVHRLWRGGPIPGTGLFSPTGETHAADDLQRDLDAVRRDALADMPEDEEDDDPDEDVIAEGGVVRSYGFTPAQED